MPTSQAASLKLADEVAELVAVRAFWEQNPLFAGVSRFAPGTREFFLDHRSVALKEHSGRLDDIYTTDVTPGCKVLDVGCGIGFWVDEFSRRGATVVACDITETAVQITRRRLNLFGLQADVSIGNAEDLPYPPARFDHVNCQGVIHHTPRTEACISEFHRVLRPGGTLCFSVYYRVMPLRSRTLFRFITALTRSWMRLPGRGREDMLTVDTPEELVRLYDGRDNPLGKAYTRGDIARMLAGRFRVLAVKRNGIPRSALPFHIPDWMHRMVCRCFGLMIVYRCQKV